MTRYVCDVAECEQGFDVLADCIAHERTHAVCPICGGAPHDAYDCEAP